MIYQHFDEEKNYLYTAGLNSVVYDIMGDNDG